MNKIIETVPELNSTVRDIENLQTELAQYTAQYQHLFRRREQREYYETYLKGLMLALPNKSVETMMLNLTGDDANAICMMRCFGR